MPIIVGNKPIFRIKFKDANIREVRKSNDLQWGLYEVTYINDGPNTTTTGYTSSTNVPTYVWGYPNQTSKDHYIYEPAGLDKHNFNLHVPENATAAEAQQALGDGYGYKSHSDGWFDNNGCINYPSAELYYIPAITKDFHRDLDLFCKWRQRRYRYTGTYRYAKYVEQWVPDD